MVEIETEFNDINVKLVKRRLLVELKNFLKHQKKIRVALHLILAGCSTLEISEELEVPEGFIKKWKNLHLKSLTRILPNEPLLSIITLARIYNGIEKKRIARIAPIKKKGNWI